MPRTPLRHAPAMPSETVQSLVSLAIVLHLIVVVLAVSANLQPSPLQQRLLTVLGVYLQPLGLQLSTPVGHRNYHLTHGLPWQGEAWLEVEILEGSAAGDIYRIPGDAGGARGRQLARMMTFYASEGTGLEEQLAKLARGVGRHVLVSREQQAGLVRVMTRRPPSLGEMQSGTRPDPNAPQYLDTLYEARVWLDRDGDVQLLRRDAAGQVAPLRAGASDDE